MPHQTVFLKLYKGCGGTLAEGVNVALTVDDNVQQEHYYKQVECLGILVLSQGKGKKLTHLQCTDNGKTWVLDKEIVLKDIGPIELDLITPTNQPVFVE